MYLVQFALPETVPFSGYFEADNIRQSRKVLNYVEA